MDDIDILFLRGLPEFQYAERIEGALDMHRVSFKAQFLRLREHVAVPWAGDYIVGSLLLHTSRKR
jgi:hypothetical protein